MRLIKQLTIDNQDIQYKLEGRRNHELYKYVDGEIRFKWWNQEQFPENELNDIIESDIRINHVTKE